MSGYIAYHNQLVAEGKDPQSALAIQKQHLAAYKGVADGELQFIANGQIVVGWTSVSVNRGVERFPASFEVRGTAKLPSEMKRVLPLNTPCQISIGGHVVLTGYVERITSTETDGQHAVTWAGRGRCCDLADCAALLDNQTRLLTNLTALAKALVKPFAGPIQVITPNGDGYSRPYPQVTINLGESPYDIIERVARYEGLLVYENADGNLVLARAGTVQHSSGFIEGQNVQGAEYAASTDGRYSIYIPLLMSIDTLSRNNAAPQDSGNAAGKPAYDPLITRYRPRIIVSEQNIGDDFLAAQRAQWEATRRLGEAFRVTITTDSWLDSAGTPWTPNQLVSVYLPSLLLDAENFVIVDVHFHRAEGGGTSAVLRLMLPGGLTVQPEALNATAARALVPGPTGPTGSPTPMPAPPTAPNSGAGRTPNFNPRSNEPTGGL